VFLVCSTTYPISPQSLCFTLLSFTASNILDNEWGLSDLVPIYKLKVRILYKLSWNQAYVPWSGTFGENNQVKTVKRNNYVWY